MTLELVEASFFDRPVEIVARDLIGRDLLVSGPPGFVVAATIVETEAYGGVDDAASHAAFRPGGRATAMFGPPGTVYVYAAYGMYPCFNVVTGQTGSPSAVLLRGVRKHGGEIATHGPGRSSKLLGISLDDHGEQIPGDRFNITRRRADLEVEVTGRIGISRAVETAWRFVAIEKF